MGYARTCPYVMPRFSGTSIRIDDLENNEILNSTYLHNNKCDAIPTGIIMMTLWRRNNEVNK